jgi:hypothetical protein
MHADKKGDGSAIQDQVEEAHTEADYSGPQHLEMFGMKSDTSKK